MSRVWLKNNKVILQGEKVTLCDECPCVRPAPPNSYIAYGYRTNDWHVGELAENQYHWNRHFTEYGPYQDCGIIIAKFDANGAYEGSVNGGISDDVMSQMTFSYSPTPCAEFFDWTVFQYTSSPGDYIDLKMWYLSPPFATLQGIYDWLYTQFVRLGQPAKDALYAEGYTDEDFTTEYFKQDLVGIMGGATFNPVFSFNARGLYSILTEAGHGRLRFKQFDGGEWYLPDWNGETIPFNPCISYQEQEQAYLMAQSIASDPDAKALELLAGASESLRWGSATFMSRDRRGYSHKTVAKLNPNPLSIAPIIGVSAVAYAVSYLYQYSPTYEWTYNNPPPEGYTNKGINGQPDSDYEFGPDANGSTFYAVGPLGGLEVFDFKGIEITSDETVVEESNILGDLTGIPMGACDGTSYTRQRWAEGTMYRRIMVAGIENKFQIGPPISES